MSIVSEHLSPTSRHFCKTNKKSLVKKIKKECSNTAVVKRGTHKLIDQPELGGIHTEPANTSQTLPFG
jgi:hypothetical protein